MQLQQAYNIAVKYYHLFKPYCNKIKVAGSIRRQKAEVKDIEIVCVPQAVVSYTDSLFPEEITVRNTEFVKLVNSFPKIKGNGSGKYAQLILPEGINLDLFMCVEKNYGLMMVLRTGPWEYSRDIVTVIKPWHYVKDGYLWNSLDELIPVPEEEDFYTITKQAYLEPKVRA